VNALHCATCAHAHQTIGRFPMTVCAVTKHAAALATIKECRYRPTWRTWLRKVWRRNG
jgi:hypothetical protein